MFRHGVKIACCAMLVCGFANWLVRSANASMNPHVEDDIYERLRIWASRHGAKLGKVKWPVVFPLSGRGMGAEKLIKGNQLILEMPTNLTIYRGSAIGTAIEPITRRLDSYIGCVVALLYFHALGDKAFHKPFIDYIPREYDMVDEWTDDELLEFQDKEIFHWAKQRRDQHRTDLATFKHLMRKYCDEETKKLLAHVDHNIFRWAWNTVGTRSFGLTHVEGEENCPTLVPIADLINYSPESTGLWYVEDGFMRIRAGAGDVFYPGTELVINYGSLSHLSTMFHYGFVVPGNVLNFEKLKLPHEDPDRERKVAANGNIDYVKLKWNVDPFDLMRFFRLVSSMSEEEFDIRAIILELRAARECRRLCTRHILTKKTSIQSDLEMLASVNANGTRARRKVLPLLLRIDQKKIIIRNLEFCSKLEQELPCTPQSKLNSPKFWHILDRLASSVNQMSFHR